MNQGFTLLTKGVRRNHRHALAVGLFSFMGMAVSIQSAQAATLCVNPHGTSGCFKTITQAVAAANAGDIINVSKGFYREDVVIEKPLSLIGEDKTTTFIDAKGLPNAVYVDGFDAPTPLAEVIIKGFTIESANFEGVLIQNASNVTLVDNIVKANDHGLDVSASKCPNQPAFETNESADCGEGIHLIAVDHSIIADNESTENSGGILASDETGTTHDNVFTRNKVHDNPYACGITLASHAGYVKTGQAPLAFGVYHNTISDNDSYHNGDGIPGGGSGVGIFAPGPGNINRDNSVVGNRLTDNALAGVALHNHVFLTFPGHPPNPILSDNAIVGNYIAGNGPDGSLPTTGKTGISILGTTPAGGMVITGNIIEDEDIDIAMNDATTIDVHLNDFRGGKIGIDNLNKAGRVDATNNWWGCTEGPGTGGCSSPSGTNVIVAPWSTVVNINPK